MLTDHVAATVHKDGAIKAFHESRRRDGHTTVAELNDENILSHSISGPGSHGEEHSLACCIKLIGKLNRLGATWGEPALIEEEDVDCRVTDASCPERILNIQVVRANAEQKLWQELSVEGATKIAQCPASDIASIIRYTIERKRRKIPESARSNLLLALDATLLPAYGFDDVIQTFRLEYGSWASSLGFLAIWIVGQTNELCHRLDWESRKSRCFSNDDIAVAAYFVWETEGRPHGRHIDHWFMGIDNLKQLHA